MPKPDPDLVFALPGNLNEESIDSIVERATITDLFLRGKASATDYLDYISESVDPSQFIESVESNLNHIVDIYGRPIL